ncbi:MAG TPA: 5'-nucleotidase C-terminal domain-containing protein, partial [Myxococcota bacterium]|nr:5'-nucleotidase C-terminal domain-containing protein [Myxococcota bacterium]
AFPVLAANYDFEDADLPYISELERVVFPTAMFDLDGLRVGFIGLGNLSSLNSIYDESNSMGIKVMEIGEVIPREASLLKAQGADLVVILSHMGLDDDIEMARQFPEIDLIMGGHHHVAIDPPLVVTNEETGKRVIVCHSGAFAKFVGRLDLVVQDGQILSHDYTLFPVDRTVPADPAVYEIMREYQEQLDYDYNLDQVLGYAETALTRYGLTGGDSMLGNFTAEAMRAYPGVETEIALTNTLGIRSDIPVGNITLDALYNAMPFDNTITTMFLSGREVQELLDYVAYRSSERGCSSQAQVAGISFTMDCRNQVAKDIVINGVPLDLDGTYELATNNYIAHGGSGFEVLERNTTQVDTGVSIRDVVKEAITRYRSLPQADAGICVEDGRINPVF